MPSSDRRRDLIRVVLWMTGALLSFSAMAVSIRALAGTLRIMEILAIRNGGGLEATRESDVVLEREVDHAIGRGSCTSQGVHVIQSAALHLCASRFESCG